MVDAASPDPEQPSQVATPPRGDESWEAWRSWFDAFGYWKNLEAFAALAPLRERSGFQTALARRAPKKPKDKAKTSEDKPRGDQVPGWNVKKRFIRKEWTWSTPKTQKKGPGAWDMSGKVEPNSLSEERDSNIKGSKNKLLKENANAIAATPLFIHNAHLGRPEDKGRQVRHLVVPRKETDVMAHALGLAFKRMHHLDGGGFDAKPFQDMAIDEADELPLMPGSQCRLIATHTADPRDTNEASKRLHEIAGDIIHYPVIYAQHPPAEKEGFRKDRLTGDVDALARSAFAAYRDNQQASNLVEDHAEALKHFEGYAGHGFPLPTPAEIIYSCAKPPGNSDSIQTFGEHFGPEAIAYEVPSPKAWSDLRDLDLDYTSKDHGKFVEVTAIHRRGAWIDMVPSTLQFDTLALEQQAFIEYAAMVREGRQGAKAGWRADDDLDDREPLRLPMPLRIMPLTFRSSRGNTDLLDLTLVWTPGTTKQLPPGRELQAHLWNFSTRLARLVGEVAGRSISDVAYVHPRELDWSTCSDPLAYLAQEYGADNESWALPDQECQEHPEEFWPKLPGLDEKSLASNHGYFPVPRGRLLYEGRGAQKAAKAAAPPGAEDWLMATAPMKPVKKPAWGRRFLFASLLPPECTAWRTRVHYRRGNQEDSK